MEPTTRGGDHRNKGTRWFYRERAVNRILWLFWVLLLGIAGLLASLNGCAGTMGLGSWVFGLGQVIWPAHPQMASFLLTLVTTIVIQITWPRLTETNSG
jgi:predicted lysophospholipase L1 biosynthesis ABC-type transport system permease subunit